jgi:hypothetical protein
MQPSEQHSVADTQLAAAGVHCAVDELHVLVAESHSPEQQSVACWQTPPKAAHFAGLDVTFPPSVSTAASLLPPPFPGGPPSESVCSEGSTAAPSTCASWLTAASLGFEALCFFELHPDEIPTNNNSANRLARITLLPPVSMDRTVTDRPIQDSGFSAPSVDEIRLRPHDISCHYMRIVRVSNALSGELRNLHIRSSVGGDCTYKFATIA